MINNLVSQAATMERNGVPNDIVNNVNPIALVIFIPIFDQFVYPFLARRGIRFTPIKRITAGFLAASLSMVTAAVIQYYIYKTSRKSPGHFADNLMLIYSLSMWLPSKQLRRFEWRRTVCSNKRLGPSPGLSFDFLLGDLRFHHRLGIRLHESTQEHAFIGDVNLSFPKRYFLSHLTGICWAVKRPTVDLAVHHNCDLSCPRMCWLLVCSQEVGQAGRYA